MAFISPLDSLLSDDKITSEVSFQVSKLIVLIVELDTPYLESS